MTDCLQISDNPNLYLVYNQSFGVISINKPFYLARLLQEFKKNQIDVGSINQIKKIKAILSDIIKNKD